MYQYVKSCLRLHPSLINDPAFVVTLTLKDMKVAPTFLALSP